jgi:hypothetical protein
MVIRESDGQLEISGSPAELNEIAEGIEGLAAGAEFSIGADAGADPRPYDQCLAALEVRVTDGPVRVATSGDYVVVTGGVPTIRTFGSCFRFDEGAARGMHCHHEWFEGNDYVARDSVPLVISVG